MKPIRGSIIDKFNKSFCDKALFKIVILSPENIKDIIGINLFP